VFLRPTQYNLGRAVNLAQPTGLWPKKSTREKSTPLKKSTRPKSTQKPYGSRPTIGLSS